MVYFAALHVDCAEGACRAKVLAGPAPDATFLVHNRYLGRIGVGGIGRHHQYGPGRTVAGTVAAVYAVGQRHAVLLYPHGVPYLCGRLVGQADGADGPGGADFGTTVALGAAVSAFVGHLGLHQAEQAGGGAQHLVGADRYAQLATGAMLGEVACAQCSRRHDGGEPPGGLLVLDDGQAAVHLLLLLRQHSRGGQQGRGSQEGAARAFVGWSGGRRGGSGLLGGQAVGYGSVLALADAVHAGHTTAVVHAVVLVVNAGCLATAGAEAARRAFVGINPDAQQ